MLNVNNIEVIYDDVILVLKGLSMEVKEGQVVALLGANGAGKTTTLKAISGLLKVEDGEVTDGTIEFMGERIDKKEAEEILRIRNKKQPVSFPSAGSFFKNPVVNRQLFESLNDRFPAMPGWKTDSDKYKLSAAWLIEQCGWKGKRHHDAGVSENHALVLVNHNNASGADIWHLAEMIIDSAAYKQMDPEVKNSMHREVARVKGFESGYYDEAAQQPNYTQTDTNTSNDALLEAMFFQLQRNNDILERLEANGLSATVSTKDMKSMKNLQEGIKDYNTIRTQSKI